MKTIEVAPRDWTRALDEFSARHQGWRVRLENFARVPDAQPQIRNMRLCGVSADTDSRGTAITIAAAPRDGQSVRHTIRIPRHVSIARTTEGADVALHIESPEGAAVLLITDAILPGLARAAARTSS